MDASTSYIRKHQSESAKGYAGLGPFSLAVQPKLFPFQAWQSLERTGIGTSM